MEILICSDLHMEFDIDVGSSYTVPTVENEKDIVLVLAGDIALIKSKPTYVNFITNVCSRFKAVIWICGNHEMYGSNFPTALSKLQKNTEQHKNLHVVEKETVIIEDVAFVCATLWTNMDNNDVMLMHDAKLWMNDYKKIRTGPKFEPWRQKLIPVDTVTDFYRSKGFIFPEIVKHKESGKKIVVVTHHLPSFQSIPERYRGDKMNGAYASELFEDIMDTEPDIWVHGHIHDSMDYMIGTTRIVCNPRGYFGVEENGNFNPVLTIDL